MNFDALTDKDIAELINLEKKVKNPGSRWSENRGNRQRNYNVSGGDFLFSKQMSRICLARRPYVRAIESRGFVQTVLC